MSRVSHPVAFFVVVVATVLALWLIIGVLLAAFGDPEVCIGGQTLTSDGTHEVFPVECR